MFQAKDYTHQEALRGEPAKALETARVALLGQGFEITHQTDDELQARGPGLNSNREPPLRGATEVHVRVSRSEIRLDAKLGGVARMKATLFLLPVGLAVLFLAISLLTGSGRWWIWVLPLAPWPILAPLIGLMVERRTRNALDGLARSMSVTSR